MDKKIFFCFALLSFSAVVPLTEIAAANCRAVSGQTYYTDGVAFFSDANCRQETTPSAAAAEVSSQTAAPAQSGVCKYSTARKQYTDGVSFFLDAKCINEALAGETVAAPSTVPPAQTVAAAATSPQSSQLSARISALEKKVAILQSMIAQILAILAKK